MAKKEMSPLGKELFAIAKQANALQALQHAELTETGVQIASSALSEAKQHLPVHHTSGAPTTRLEEP